ncbi:MAG: DinB family protein [Hymenobacteraceae bacterium]|mgnify:CR=1 FL=1|nr:DinB family protein [Hymenobacteraceae bacterium]MDX5397029.1 DinB family protein [Hymenobacteraceae bacterium]MDX5513103.1 DinB family protein [Hymenobacteraceae bacterium]
MLTITENLAKLFERDLDRLETEISQYETDEKLWEARPGTSNSGGNLCLHLLGNLQHFFGTVLRKTPYKRNREAEFSSRDIPREELYEEIEKTKAVVGTTLRNMTQEELDQPFPVEVFGHPMSTEEFVLHLLTHLSYHLGQINFHRRIEA